MNSHKKYRRLPIHGLLCAAILPLVATAASKPLPAKTAFVLPSAGSAQSAGSGNNTGASAAGATITFRKIFKSSFPEFVEIKLDQTGSGTYDIRQMSDAASPQAFTIGAPLTRKIFELAGKLHDFQGVDLEIHRRIANLGEKTFRYEEGGAVHEVSFNYTLDPNATQLLAIFEGLTRQEMDLSDLQRTMRYDHLGVNDALMQIEADYNNKQLPEADRFLGLLDQIAADTRFIDIARDRARTLAGRIRSASAS